MTDDPVDIWLEHYGVKGMKWGVVKEDEPSKKGITKKQVAVAGGVVLAAAAVAAGAYYLKTNPKLLATAVKDIPKPEEPTKVIHMARAKNYGFKFLTDGGVKDPSAELYKMGAETGLDIATGGLVNDLVRYGSRNEKIFASFVDPNGRRDRAGRPISHQFIIPELKAVGIKTLDQVKDLVWDEVKDSYEEFYNRPAPENRVR